MRGQLMTRMFGMANAIENELPHMVVLKPVEHGGSLASRLDQPSQSELCQVL